jgi:RNA polymerase sigma factor (sigma-70 family)
MSTAATLGQLRPARPLRRYDRHVTSTPRVPGADPLDVAFATGRADLRAVYDAHASLVYGMCRKALGGTAADDVTQEVFVSAWRARDRFDPTRGNLSQWLSGITKRRIIDHLRSEGRHANRRADDTAIERGSVAVGDDVDESTDTVVDRLADRALAAEALAQLAERPRRVIELAYLHDLTHQQIAEQTGLPLGTIKSDIRRGLQRIRDHLEPKDG